jgi:hypothetical protein
MSQSNDSEDQSSKLFTAGDAYRTVSDTVTGPNVRFKDNLFQAIAVVVGAVIGAPLGYYLTL